METKLNQNGFGFIGILALIVVVGAIALIGLKVMDMHYAKPVVSDSTPAQTAVPVKIANQADLQKASVALDSTNVDQVDLNQLDSDLNALL